MHLLACTEVCKQMRFEASPVLFELILFPLLAAQFSAEFRESGWTALNAKSRGALRKWTYPIRQFSSNAIHVEIDIGLASLDPGPTGLWPDVIDILSLCEAKEVHVFMVAQVSIGHIDPCTLRLPLAGGTTAALFVEKIIRQQTEALDT